MSATIIALLAIKIYPTKIVKNLLGEDKQKQTLAAKIAKPSPVSQNSENTSAQQELSPPTFISIPSVNINLPISPGQIVDNVWTLSDTRISWLSTSEVPGSGNVILYGHNRTNVLGNLANISVGAEINVKTKDKVYTYLVSEKRKVTPQDVDSIISPRDQLTVYTCDGNFDEKRLIVIAYPKA